MKKTLKTLISLDQQKLDQQRRDLAALETRLFQFQSKRNQLVSQKTQEIKKIDVALLSYDILPHYQKRMDDQIKAIDRQIEGFRMQIERQRDILHQTYSQMKKYQTAYVKLQEEEQQEIAQREQKDLDEVNIQAHNQGR